ncbi:MAG TPA: hypothetical protein VFG55_06830, partial [Rhodanobacteraceae bacterium]|nr:hypothetical protein [Rhodanobacteraceae bacterium]
MRISAWALCALLCTASLASADPLGTDFTYQGQLSDADLPANGSYDVQFALYTVAEDGTAVDTIEVDALAVIGGLIAVS